MTMIFAAALLLTSCSQDVIYENVYEGFRVQQRLENAPEEATGDQTPMSYRQYQQERTGNE